MQDQLAEILFYIKGTLKYKWIIIITAWLISVAGWTFINTMPDKFKSEARVSVDSRTMLRPLLRGMAIQANTRGLIQIMQQLMFTRPNLEKIAKLADLDIDSKSEAQKLGIIAGLRSAVKITGGRNDLFSISYETIDAQKAQDVVHAVLTVFSEQAQQRTSGDTGSAQQFIEEQLREYEVRLRNAEKARENFKRINSGLLPEQGGGQLTELDNIQSQIQLSKMALNEANSKWYVLKRQIQEVIDTQKSGSGSVMTVKMPEDSKIEELTAQKDALLLRYTERHPNILSIDSIIKDLEKSKQKRIASMPKNSSILNSGAMTNPYVQSLKTSLNQVEAERASLFSRIHTLKTRVKDIQLGMDARLSIETEMKNLDRDYSVIKSNYMKLIERREQAQMTERADRSQGVLRFKIADAPSRPLSASSPNRKLLNSGVLIAGLSIGIMIAFLIYFIRPTFMSTQQLRTVTGLPVLGSVGVQLKADEKISRFPIISFWVVALGLIIAYVCVITNCFGLL